MKKATLAMVLAAGLAVPAMAQDVVLRLVTTQDLSNLDDEFQADGITPNPFRIGSFISAVELAGERLWVGGFNQTGSSGNFRLVQVGNAVSGPRNFTNLPSNPAGDSFDFVLINGRNVGGMDYRAGSGLLMTIDRGAQNNPGSIFSFDVDSGPLPSLISTGVPGVGRNIPRVGGAAAWDPGFDGLGFDFTADTAGNDGPLAAVIDFGPPGSALGPIGVRPVETSEGTAFDLNRRTYDGTAAPGGGPTISQARADAEGETLNGTLFRDIDISEDGRVIAVRANNDVAVFERTTGNADGNYEVIKGTTPLNAFVNGAHVAVVSESAAGSFVIFNDRPDFSGPPNTLSGFTRAARFDGTPLTIAWEQANGAPLVFTANTSGWLDYSWDEANQRLAISEAGTGLVRIFEVLTPGGGGCPCAADYDGSGGTPDGSDIDAFFSDWINGEMGSDVDCSGGTPDGTDIDVFFSQWLNGGC